jgi:hypothetical protein
MIPKFGQKVWIDHKLVRSVETVTNVYGPEKKFWKARKMKKTRAVFLGVRVLSDGKRTWGNEAGFEYKPMQYFKAWLVCVLGRNPFYVMPEKPVGKRLIEVFA